MKQTSAVLFCLFLLTAAPVFAQQKYGHINSSEVLQAMPEFKQLSGTIDSKKKEAQTKLEKMYQDYQGRQKEISDYGASMMQAVKEEKMKQLDSAQAAITAFQQTENAKLQELQEKMLKPLNDKYLKIVSAVAKENGYTYIFDISQGGVAYYPEKTGDITDLVRKKLGIN